MSRHKSLTPEQARELVRLSRNGSGMDALAVKFNVSTATVRAIKHGRRYTEYTGLTPRRGRPGRPRRLSDEMAVGIVVQAQQGVSHETIAREFQIDRDLVNRVASGRSYSDVTGVAPSTQRRESRAVNRNLSRVRALRCAVECIRCGTSMRKTVGRVWRSLGAIYCEQCAKERQ